MILKYIEKHWRNHSALIAFCTGIGFTLISYFISAFLFRYTPHLIGITTIFFTVIITMPVLNFILKQEEQMEKKKGNFFKKNGKVIDFYVYFFLGVFLMLLILSFLMPWTVFSKEHFYNIQPSKEIIKVPGALFTQTQLLQQIITNNLYLGLAALIISLFFGAGSIFLLVLNASMAAAFLSSIIRSSDGSLITAFICKSSIFSIHFLPEMIGILIAALAGGLLYIDFAKEKLLSKNFDTVVSNAMKLLGIAIITILIAGILEVYVSKSLFESTICTTNAPVVAIILATIVAVIIFFERIRIKHHKKI